MASWFEFNPLTRKQMVDIPPVWLLLFLCAAYASGLALPATVAPFGWARWVGAGLAGVGVGLMVWALLAFRAHATSVVPHQNPRRMITTGPFAISRNPIYLGDTLVLAGAAFWWGHWLALALVVPFVLLIQRRFIAPEEQRLKESFGMDFVNYAQKTRRWV